MASGSFPFGSRSLMNGVDREQRYEISDIRYEQQ
jgi:hypothetical protein